MGQQIAGVKTFQLLKQGAEGLALVGFRQNAHARPPARPDGLHPAGPSQEVAASSESWRKASLMPSAAPAELIQFLVQRRPLATERNQGLGRWVFS